MAVDDSETHNPGYKFNEWEMRGTPVRLEIGARDIEQNEVRCVVRHSGEKFQRSQVDLAQSLSELIQTVHE